MPANRGVQYSKSTRNATTLVHNVQTSFDCIEVIILNDHTSQNKESINVNRNSEISYEIVVVENYFAG